MILNRIFLGLRAFGIDLSTAVQSIRGIAPFLVDLQRFKMLRKLEGHAETKIRLQPCLHDRFASSGTASGHYFHQDLLVAQYINAQNPVNHADVGSRVDGFVAHVAAFRVLDVFDIRPLKSTVANIRFIQADLTTELPQTHREKYDSVSCLHALEHFGLGRYGDRIDPRGHVVGLKNISSLLKPGGHLFLSVPIGRDEIRFNANRIFSLASCLALLGDAFDIREFSFVDDDGNLQRSAQLTTKNISQTFGLRHGLGIFWLVKNA